MGFGWNRHALQRGHRGVFLTRLSDPAVDRHGWKITSQRLPELALGRTEREAVVCRVGMSGGEIRGGREKCRAGHWLSTLQMNQVMALVKRR